MLLFVFWYCHKRGRETRLAQEALDADGNPTTDPERFEEYYSDEDGNYYEEEPYENTPDSYENTRDGEVGAPSSSGAAEAESSTRQRRGN